MLSTNADMNRLVVHRTPPIMIVGLSPASSDVFVIIGPEKKLNLKTVYGKYVTISHVH